MTAYCDYCGLPKIDCICDDESFEVACPSCLAIWGFEEIDRQHCAACGWPDNDDGDGFWYTDEEGETAHILGDPNMGEETLAALNAMIKAARKAIDEGILPRKKDSDA